MKRPLVIKLGRFSPNSQVYIQHYYTQFVCSFCVIYPSLCSALYKISMASGIVRTHSLLFPISQYELNLSDCGHVPAPSEHQLKAQLEKWINPASILSRMLNWIDANPVYEEFCVSTDSQTYVAVVYSG